MNDKKRDDTLLIVYHSQSGNTERMSVAIEQGARKVQGVKVRRLRAWDTTSDDMEKCRVLVVCSPEYFGYMAGAIKDLFDRTYEDVRERVAGKPYTIVVSAGNDGSGALTSIERIALGYGFRKIQEPIVSKGSVPESVIDDCERLGETLAAGIELGIY